MNAVLPPAQAALAACLVAALRREAQRLAADACPAGLALETAEFAAVRDPADARPAYAGVWRNARGERCGGLSLNADGSGFAEYDLCMPHPARPFCFVEAVSAWGRDAAVKSEVRLLDMPRDEA